MVKMLRAYSGLGEKAKEIAYGILLSWHFNDRCGVWFWFINFQLFCTTTAPKVFIDDIIFAELRLIYPLKNARLWASHCAETNAR